MKFSLLCFRSTQSHEVQVNAAWRCWVYQLESVVVLRCQLLAQAVSSCLHTALCYLQPQQQPRSAGIAVLGELSTVYFIEQGATETNLALLISRLFSIFTKFCMMIKLIVITEGQKEDGMSYRHGSLPELQRCFC